jgi:hypothetical protein
VVTLKNYPLGLFKDENLGDHQSSVSSHSSATKNKKYENLGDLHSSVSNHQLHFLL